MSPFGQLWERTKTFFSRLFRREPPEPGRYEEGSKVSWHGWIGVAPWIWPSRDYLVYIPRGGLGWRRRTLLVLVHGCKQTPEEIAQGTRIASLADEIGCIVLLPRQNPRANAYGCWNWFDRRTSEGQGETAILAAQIRSVRRRYRAHRGRIFAAGMSSGAALVSALALRNPGLLRGVFLHSALAAGAASSPMTAIQVMKDGPDTDVVRLARLAREQARDASVPAVCIVHGAADPVVAQVNADEAARQMLAFAAYPDVASAPAGLPPASAEQRRDVGAGRSMLVREWRHDRRLVVREMVVDGLAHAWSGGNPELAYNDAGPPNASGLLRDFMSELST